MRITDDFMLGWCIFALCVLAGVAVWTWHLLS